MCKWLSLGIFDMCFKYKNRSGMHRTYFECLMEHGFNDNPDMERKCVDTDYCRNIQCDRQYNRMSLFLQCIISLGRRSMYFKHENRIMYRSSIKCAVEHSFKHNPDLERKLVTDNHRSP